MWVGLDQILYNIARAKKKKIINISKTRLDYIYYYLCNYWDFDLEV